MDILIPFRQFLECLISNKDQESNTCSKTMVKLATGRSCEKIDFLNMEDGWVSLFASLCFYLTPIIVFNFSGLHVSQSGYLTRRLNQEGMYVQNSGCDWELLRSSFSIFDGK